MNATGNPPTEGNGSLYAPPAAVVEDIGEGFRSGDTVVYAGFWRRTAAFFIDATLIMVAYYALLIAAMLVIGLGRMGALEDIDAAGGGTFGVFLAAMYLAYPIVSALYYVGMESSGTQATLGKMAVGIKVTDADGRRLRRGQALGRWVSHLLCYVTLYIGYIMAGFTDRKRGLHDMVANTLVVDRWAYTHDPGRQQKGLGTVAIVVLILGSLAVVAYIAVIAAIALPAYQGYMERAATGG
ncbi:MAG TPA: RDD family protein [Thermomonas sp.]|nr:RDD family protein [Thermomonas sp.]